MKKLIALLLAVCMLAGCQLASGEKNEDPMQDKLVGVFITFERLDLPFDMEGYLRDNGIPEDGIVLDGSGYEGRLWAKVTEEGWSFPGYDGIIMGQMWNEDHWMGFSTEGIQDIKTHVTGTETLDGVAEEGTIYISSGKEVLFCTNPVYMTPEGTYYALQGDSFQSSLESGSMSQSIRDEKTWTTDGETYTYSAEYRTTIQGVKLADRVMLVQMSADHQELDRAEYAPDAMRGSLTIVDGAAYLIVEEWAGEEVTRTIFQPGDDHINVFYQTEQIYCLPSFTEINWNE